MDSKLGTFLLETAWRFPLIRAFSSRQPVILLYHGIPADGDGRFVDREIFEAHVRLLKQHFVFISPGEIGKPRNWIDKIHVLLTFDDGFRNHAEVVAPILRKYQVPAIFFVCSRHATPGKYLWFSYLRGLEKHFRWNSFSFRGQLIDMSPGQRQLSMRRLWELLLNLAPHPVAMYQAIEEELPRLEEFIPNDELGNCYAGMTVEQMGEIAADPLFSLGIHTVDHPLLTKCDEREAFRQIQENQTWIEQVCHQQCSVIAYPSGDYDDTVLRQCHALGLTTGYAVIPQKHSDALFEMPRIGIHSPSLAVLGFKVQWGNLLRAWRVRVG
jgi:peptidoglycan/xylan/chitin deacetylase (PgdA/CDA1 family)